MRTILPLVLALASSTLLPAPDADACGGYTARDTAPDAFAMSSHASRGHRVARTFVYLGSPAPAGLTWTELAPRSYDATRVAPAPAASAPMTLTLVGRGGTRAVSSTRRVFVDHSFEVNTPTLALEIAIPRGSDYKIALAGRHDDARWGEVPQTARTAADTAWARSAAPSADVENVAVHRIPGSRTDLLTYHVDGAPVTAVRVGETGYAGAYPGYVLGSVTVAGTRYIAFGARGHVQLAQL